MSVGVWILAVDYFIATKDTVVSRMITAIMLNVCAKGFLILQVLMRTLSGV